MKTRPSISLGLLLMLCLSSQASVLQVEKSASVTGHYADAAKSVFVTNQTDITYFFEVTNVSAEPISGVLISDSTLDIEPKFDASWSNLLPGQSVTAQVNAVALQSFTNTADFFALREDFTVLARMSSSAIVTFIDPSIGIVVEMEPGLSGTPGTALFNEIATYHITVSNEGDIELTDITVASDLDPPFQTNLTALGVGESQSWAVTRQITRSSTNAFDVSALSLGPFMVSSATNTEVNVLESALQLEIAIGRADVMNEASTNHVEIVESLVGIRYEIFNAGQNLLTNVVLLDPGPNLPYSNIVSHLAPGETAVFTNQYQASDSHLHQASASGVDAVGNLVAASAEAQLSIIRPLLQVEKRIRLAGRDEDPVDLLLATNGASIEYLISVLNAGDVALTNVTLLDEDLYPSVTTNWPALQVGEQAWIMITSTVAASLTNTVLVSAYAPTGDRIESTDHAVVRQIQPGIELVKRIRLAGDEGGGAQQLTVTNGTRVAFFFQVRNMGDVELRNVTLEDPLLQPEFITTWPLIQIGETYEAEVEYTSIGSLTNVATVTALGPNGEVVSAADAAYLYEWSGAMVLPSLADIYNLLTIGTLADLSQRPDFMPPMQAPGQSAMPSLADIMDAMPLASDGAAGAEDVRAGRVIWSLHSNQWGTITGAAPTQVLSPTASVMQSGFYDEIRWSDLIEVQPEQVRLGSTLFGVIGSTPFRSPWPAPIMITGATNSLVNGDDGSRRQGEPWPQPRFQALVDEREGVVRDRATGLYWKRQPLPQQVNWTLARNEIDRLNEAPGFAGYNDWRMPNIREILSLIDYGRSAPALPHGHPFQLPSDGAPWIISSTYAPHISSQQPLNFIYRVRIETGAFVANIPNGQLTEPFQVWVVRGGVLPE